MRLTCSLWTLARTWLVCMAAAISLLAASATVQAAPRDRHAPSNPTNLRTTAVGSYAVSLAWNASTDTSPFSYYIAMIDGYATRSAVVPQTQRTYTWSTDLKPSRVYKFYVWAMDAAGNRSSITNIITLTTPADTLAPTAPVVSVQSIGSDYVSLSWTGAVDDGPAANVRFRVFRNGVQIAQDLFLNGFTQSGLSAGSTHTYTVQARDPFGNWSPLSNALTVTTPTNSPGDVTPPTTPSALYAEQFGDAEFWLHWVQSTDNVTPQSRIRYEVYVDGTFSDVMIGSGGPSINYLDGTESLVEVIAVDERGNRSAPAQIFLRI